MNNLTKLFLVEGEDRDPRILDYMIKSMFKGKFKAAVITIPAYKNLYMLYNTLSAADGFALDVVEVIREQIEGAREILEGIERQDIDEIFLFFDYDIHQTNLPKGVNPIDVLEKMLCYFNNETENGKLYISYPMIEAVYDYIDVSCTPFSECYISVDKLEEYKNQAGDGNIKASKHLIYEDWAEILTSFSQRIVCLLEVPQLDYEYYKSHVTPLSIMKVEMKYLKRYNAAFVLSALPEMLFDYFKNGFWISHFNTSRKAYTQCKTRLLIDSNTK